MNLGTFVVLAVLVAIVSAIIWSMVRAKRQGRHVGCDDCGGCDGSNAQSCARAEEMVSHLKQDD